MRKVAYWSLCSAALLVVGLWAGCSRGEPTDSFAGVHVFEGQVSESGGNFVLQVGDVQYALEGNSDEISKLAGQTAQVTASIDGDTLKVTRIIPAPIPPPQEIPS